MTDDEVPERWAMAQRDVLKAQAEACAECRVPIREAGVKVISEG